MKETLRNTENLCEQKLGENGQKFTKRREKFNTVCENTCKYWNFLPRIKSDFGKVRRRIEKSWQTLARFKMFFVISCEMKRQFL